MSSIEDLKDFMERYEAAKGDAEAVAKLQREAFDFVDKDGSGFIEKEEIERIFRGMVKMMLAKMGMTGELPPEAQAEMDNQVTAKAAEMMAALDSDSDGKVSFEEFQKGAAKIEEMGSQ